MEKWQRNGILSKGVLEFCAAREEFQAHIKLSSIEHIYGYDYVTSCYKDSPQDSWKQIVDYMHEMYPEATDKQIRKVLK